MRIMLIYLIGFVLCINTIESQSFAEMGTTWSYMLSIHGPGDIKYIEELKVDGEIEFEGKIGTTISMLTGHCESPYSPAFSQFLSYEDSVVYFFNWNLHQWVKMYDYNLKSGESYDILLSDNCSQTITIDSIGYEIIDGVELKVQYVSHSNGGRFPGNKIYEKLGSEFYLFPTKYNSDCANFCDGTSIINGLRCYNDNEISYSNNITSGDCLTISKLSGFSNREINIFPNPTQNLLTLDISEEIQSEVNSLNILDISGRLMKSLNNDENLLKINVDNLNDGFYFLVLNLKNSNIVIKKFLKM